MIWIKANGSVWLTNIEFSSGVDVNSKKVFLPPEFVLFAQDAQVV